MTISATTPVQQYNGTGANTSLSTVFPFFVDADVVVTQRVSATGVDTTMVLGVHYAMTGGSSIGAVGTVTPLDGATDFTSSMTWTIERLIPLAQSLDYIENDNFPAVSHEAGLDKVTMQNQDKDTIVQRSIRFPSSDTTALTSELPDAVLRASKALTFDSSGSVTLTDPASASGTTVTATGSTTSRTLQERFSAVFNVKDYGAIGDGAVNDTVAIQLAITTAENASGGLVYLPRGVYMIDAQLDVEASNVYVGGDGPGATTIKRIVTSDLVRMIRFRSVSAPFFTNLGLLDIELDGNGSDNLTGLNGFGVVFAAVEDFACHNVSVKATRSPAFLFGNNGDVTKKSSRGMVSNIEALDVGDIADAFANDASTAPDAIGLAGCTHSVFSNIIVKDVGSAASGITFFNGSNNNLFQNVNIQNVENAGIGIDGVLGTVSGCTNNLFLNVSVDNSGLSTTGKAGILVATGGSNDADVSGNIFLGLTVDSMSGSPGHGFQINNTGTLGNADYTQAIGMLIRDCAGNAVSASKARKCTFIGSAVGNVVNNMSEASSSTDNVSMIRGGAQVFVTGTTSHTPAPAMLGGYANPSAGATSFASHISADVSSENEAEIEVPYACTMRNMRVRLANAPVGSETQTITLRKNATTDTNVEVVITGSATTGQDAVDSVSFAAGDRYVIKFVASASAAANPHAKVSIECHYS